MKSSRIKAKSIIRGNGMGPYLPTTRFSHLVAAGHSGLGPATRLSLQKLQLLKGKKTKNQCALGMGCGCDLYRAKAILDCAV